LIIGSTEREKQAAAEAGAALASEGMRVGLGTGSTVERLLPVLARRALKDVVYVATSPRTARAARELGLDVRPFTTFDRLDLAIDGADQIAPTGWLVKGGGGAHTREKVVAAAAERFVVIASSNKLVAALAPRYPLNCCRSEWSRRSVCSSQRRCGQRRQLRTAASSPTTSA
jgi:ribose 5-phosphate isomerase A